MASGARANRSRSSLVESALSQPSPEPTIWPLIAALATGVTFITLIFTPWGFPIGVVLITLAFLGWAWPSRTEHELRVREERAA